MIKVKLYTKQFEYIVSELSIERKDLTPYFKGSRKGDKITIELDEDTADEIRDWAGEKLQKVGFDKDYNLTAEGKILEELTDLLYS